MSKEYEKELEKTIEHLHKVIEEKTTLIDQQKEMLNKFINGEISSTSRYMDDAHPGYVNVPAYQGEAGPGPLGSIGQAVYNTTANNSSWSGDEPNTDTL